MTIAPRGSSTTLIAEFFQYPGGPLQDVTGISVKIVNISTGAVIVSGAAVSHPGVGTYSYLWVVPVGLPLGDYLVTWTANEGVATEVVSIVEAAAGMGTGPCDTLPVLWVDKCLQSLSPAVTGAALQAASELVWSLSGQRFGLCTQVLRPCRRECQGMPWPYGDNVWPYTTPGMTYPLPVWWNGQWLNLTCGSCSSDCSCGTVEEVVLPGGVYQILEVKVDGVALSPSAYRLDDNRIVVRVDGGTWPLCNDLSQDDTAVGTWSITAQWGEPLPEIGKLAVGQLACEFGKYLSGQDCALPQAVTSLSRQGVSMQFGDAQEALQAGHLGLQWVDMFLATYNPGGLRARSQVYDVDGPNIRRAGSQ